MRAGSSSLPDDDLLCGEGHGRRPFDDFPKRERIDLPKPMIRHAQKIIGGARSMIFPERERIDLPKPMIRRA